MIIILTANITVINWRGTSTNSFHWISITLETAGTSSSFFIPSFTPVTDWLAGSLCIHVVMVRTLETAWTIWVECIAVRIAVWSSEVTACINTCQHQTQHDQWSLFLQWMFAHFSFYLNYWFYFRLDRI